jgi:hypothetical protein
MAFERNIADLERNKFFRNMTQTSSNLQYDPHFIMSNNIPIADGSSSTYRVIKTIGYGFAVLSTQSDLQFKNSPGTYAWPTSASKLIAVSTEADDTAAGDGARTIVVEGLDADYNEVSETITMNGDSNTDATDTEFLRVNRAYVATAGAYTGTNVGRIIIAINGGGATQLEIPAAGSDSQAARYTIPTGYTGYLTKILFGSNAGESSSFSVWRRDDSDTIAAPFGAKELIYNAPYLKTMVFMPMEVPVKLPEKTDIWMTCIGGTGGSYVTGSFDIILVSKSE